jgi:hypothetical protein
MSSIVSERQQKLIIDVLLHRMSDEQFLRDFPLASEQAATDAGLAMLRAAARTSDPVGVEFGLYLGHRFGFSADYLDVLCELATSSWHQRHEDVVDGLAKLKSPLSVDALVASATTRHRYRDYDDSETLGVKATWALRHIESPAAVEKLGLLLRGDNAILSSEARFRLEDIQRSAKTTIAKELATAQLRLVPHDTRFNQ